MFNRWVDGSYGLKILASVFCFSSIVIMKKSGWFGIQQMQMGCVFHLMSNY